MSGAKVLTHDAVFRIEVSLSSRRSSAIVMHTTARLYSLEGTKDVQGGADDAEWKSVAYGAPCIQLMKDTTEHDSPFIIKIVIAEVESGISLWEAAVDAASGYHVMQNNFHTFKTNGKTYAIQFASEAEAGRMLESLQAQLLQKEKAETVSFEKKPEELVFKKPKTFPRRLSKKEISAPCNFKHVSGITLQRTQTCEEELRGTIQRKMRSMSLSSLTQRKVKSRSRLPGELVNGSIYTDQDQPRTRQSPDVPRKEKGKDEGRRGSSMRHKFGSMRKKKGGKQGGGVTVTVLDYPAGREQPFTRDDHRRSLPSHFKHHTRAPLGTDTFVPPAQSVHRPTNESRAPNRALSLSSGDLVDLPTASGTARQPLPLERRHTLNEHSNRPMRPLTQYSYTPYSVAQTKTIPEGSQLNSRQYMSDMSLNRMPSGHVGGRLGPGGARRSQVILESEALGAVESRERVADTHNREGRQWGVPRRSSITEAQLGGRIVWQERGMVAGMPVGNGSIPQGGGVGRQQATRQLSMSRSTGSIHDPVSPPPLPPPNTTQTAIGHRTAGADVPPQHSTGTTRMAQSGNPAPQSSQASARRMTSDNPGHGRQHHLDDSTDPQPYATIGFKVKSKPRSNNLPPSEYDLLTPRQQTSTEPHEPARHQSSQRQPQDMANQPQGITNQPQGMANQPQGMANQPQGMVNQPRGITNQPQGVAHQPRGRANQPQGMAQRPQGTAQHPQSMGHMSHNMAQPQDIGHPPQGMDSQAPRYFPPPHVPQSRAEPGVQRHPYDVSRQEVAHGQQSNPRELSQHGQSKGFPPSYGGPHRSISQGPYPTPQPLHQQYRPPTYTQSGPSVSYAGHMATNMSYTQPGHTTTMSYPGHMSTNGSYTQQGHMTTSVLYPARMTTSVTYTHPGHMTTTVSYPGHMTANVSYPQQNRALTHVSPSSPSHPSTQVAPVPSLVHGPRQSFQPTPIPKLVSQAPPPTGRRYQHPQGYTTAPPPGVSHQQPQGYTVAPFPGISPPSADPQEHYDVLIPRNVSEARRDGGSPSSLGSRSGEYTEQMSRALEEFDSLLAPQSKRQIMQTSL